MKALTAIKTDRGEPRTVESEPLSGTGGVFVVHSAWGWPGFAVTHAGSGMMVFNTPTRPEAIAFGLQYWAEMSDEGRTLFRRLKSGPVIAKRLPAADWRLGRRLDAEAVSLFNPAEYPR